ncbi:MAG: DMT family transporter [Pseudomonadota bacterium]
MAPPMLRAALMMILGMALIPLGDSAGKAAMDAFDVSPIFVAWTRFALGALMLLPFLGSAALEPRHLIDPRIVFRGLLIVGGIVSILTSLQTEPLPNVFAAFFIGPIVAYGLSIWLLGETANPARTVLLAVGFFGVLLVVRPGFGMSPGLAFALLAGVFYGSYLTASRWLSGVATARALLFTQLVVGAVALAPLALGKTPIMGLAVFALLAASAAASLSGNLLLVLAHRRAPASRLAPFVYFQLVAATAFGWLFFGDLPDALALSGLALLMVTGFATLALRR